MRNIEFELNYIKNADASVLISVGNTKIICSASIESRVPRFIKGTGKGWINAEYSLLPTSTHSRVQRESIRGKQTGRTMEISRLISRSLRACVDLGKLGELSIIIDCDVINADGGTRTAAISGGFVALYLVFNKLIEDKIITEMPITEFAGAVSVGIVDNKIISDLDFYLDSKAQVDMNIVMTESGKFIELQGTAEEKTFSLDELTKILEIAKEDINIIIAKQKEVLNV